MSSFSPIGSVGASLNAARELLREGHTIIVFENRHNLSGTWVHDPRVEYDPLSLDPVCAIIDTSLYHSLCTNLPCQVMGFLDYPFAKRCHSDQRTFPDHEEVPRFLNKFANEFRLRELEMEMGRDRERGKDKLVYVKTKFVNQ